MNSTPDVVAQAGFRSVFDRVFDTVVLGVGIVGYAAAKARAARGDSVLLIEASGDLLWEATRALENETGASAADGTRPQWADWVEGISAKGGVRDGFFDVALAEILTAHQLSAVPAGGGVTTLLYASPVSVERVGTVITSVTLATKSGPRVVRARGWIDATEDGWLARHVDSELVTRKPAANYRSCVLHTRTSEKLDAALEVLVKKYPRVRSFQSAREGERRLRWTVGSAAESCCNGEGTDCGGAWQKTLPKLIGELRELLSADLGATFLMSHCAMRDYPIYEAVSEKRAELIMKTNAVPRATNWVITSPALRSEPVASLKQRFELGVCAANELTHAERGELVELVRGKAVLPAPCRTLAAVDVVVAGAGTAGALAAIAAARKGARTLVLDAAPYPGGVGTGAGICGYFHGAKGGIQDEVDERTQKMTALFAGAPGTRGWHHEAKKIVLLQMFEEAGAVFVPDALLAGVERTAGAESSVVGAVLIVVNGELVRVPARAFVDSTGDGDLAAMAGADFVVGRPGDQRALAYSQSVFSVQEKGGRVELDTCNFDAGWVDPTDPEDLSRARLLGIAQHLAKSWTKPDRAVAVAPLLGLRQSRQMETDIKVTMDDLIRSARFDDALGEVETVADSHSVDYEFESDELAFYYWACRGFRHRLRSELPYRMLLPRGLENVWVACRAAGIEVDASYGLRMQREMQRLGEAAGVAVALATADRGPSSVRVRSISALCRLRYEARVRCRLSGFRRRAQRMRSCWLRWIKARPAFIFGGF